MISVITRPQNAKSAMRLGWPIFPGASQVPSGSHVIRWGNGMDEDLDSWPIVLNKSEAIQLSTNKEAALRALSAVVKTPFLLGEGQRAITGQWVVRDGTHAEGSGFELQDAPFTVPSGKHATRFIPDTREYRVWFVRDKYLCARRIPRHVEGQHPDDPCRSKWGYSFMAEVFPKLKEAMTKARVAVPLDFGAADVLWVDDFNSTGEGAWVFLEFNSAPSLDHDRVLGHFQTHLTSILATFRPREVVRPVPAPENAANRLVRSGSWEDRYKAELAAKVAARKRELEEEFYRSL